MLTLIHVLCDCYTKIFRGLNVFQSLLMQSVVMNDLFFFVFFFFFFVVNDSTSISEDYLPCARKVFTQHDWMPKIDSKSNFTK